MNINDIDAILFDLDGTVYCGSRIMPGANDAILFFREQGKRVFFSTNNSTKTRKQIFQRLTGMGVDCRLEEILTSGYLAAIYAKREDLKDIYVFGSNNLINELREAGVPVNQGEDAENLLIGYNTAMTYESLATAVRVAFHAKKMLACNRERVYPGENARLMPGCGAMTAPVEWCANRICDMVIGKPSPMMVEMVAADLGTQPDRILIVGDTYESDVAMAHNAGCQAVLIAPEHREDVATVASCAELPELLVK